VVTSFSLLVRRAGLTREEFRTHWRDVHAPLVRHVDYLRGYVQHSVAPAATGLDLPASALDGVAEFWWDDRSAALRAAGDPRYTNYAQPDEPRFLDMTRLVSVQTTPVRLTSAERPPSPGGPAALLLIVRRPALSRDAFAESCEQRWRRALHAMPGARQDCVLHLAHPSPGDETPAVDAIVVCRWQDVAARGAWQNALVVDDGRDGGRSSAFAADAHIVIAPPLTRPPAS
jgi:heme-degrading monooxygenase HmoA